MSGRRGYGIAAAAIALVEAAWFIATRYTLVENWVMSLKSQSGLARSLGNLATNPEFHFVIVLAALYLGSRALRSSTETTAPPPASAPQQVNPKTESE